MTKLSPFPKLFFMLMSALLCLGSAYAQFGVSTSAPYDSQDYLLQNVLLGEGVKAFNVKFYGNAKQIGFFSKADSVLGLSEGIVLSTGNVREIVPPQLNAAGVSTEYVPGPNQGGGDADLLRVAREVPGLIGANFYVEDTYDAAILEFDFIPSSDSVYFRYVFGSEEYFRYVDTKYNDAFGFFISGPGIDGTYSSPPAYPDSSINIAHIPFTKIPITVSSVNDRRNKEFYIDNPNNEGINFNGYTKIFTAFAKVIPCQTYHIKIAIADGTKSDLDSGVLIEARSFSSGAITLKEQIPSVSPAGEAYEGCFTASITARRDGIRSFNDTLYLSLDPSSEAQFSDISAIPPFIVIPAGSDSAQVQFQIIDDGVFEGPEWLRINFHLLSACADLKRLFELSIADAEPLAFTKPGNEAISMMCSDNFVVLDGSGKGGYGYYRYQWFKNGDLEPASGPSIVVNPSSRSLYSVTLSDTCGLTSITKFFDVTPYAEAKLRVYLPDTLEHACLNRDLVVRPDSVTGASPVVSYSWRFEGLEIGNAANLAFRPTRSGYLFLSAKDSCGDEHSDSVFVSVQASAPLSIELIGDSSLCLGHSVQILAKTNGGFGAKQLLWYDGQLGTNPRWFTPEQSILIKAEATDYCGDRASAEKGISVNRVVANFAWEYEYEGSIQVKNLSEGSDLDILWVFDRDTLLHEFEPRFSPDDVKDHTLFLKITGQGECSDSLVKKILPKMVAYIPNAFTPNGDGFNDVFKITLLEPVEFDLRIFDRWGNTVFRSTDINKGWDGFLLNSGNVVPGVYMLVLKARRADGSELIQRARISLLN